jgi:hypothetical protein
MWKWLKNVCFSGGSGWKTCVFQVEVAENCVFFGQKWLKNVHFSGGSRAPNYIDCDLTQDDWLRARL